MSVGDCSNFTDNNVTSNFTDNIITFSGHLKFRVLRDGYMYNDKNTLYNMDTCYILILFVLLCNSYILVVIIC